MGVAVSNLDFEYEWAARQMGRGWRAPSAVRKVTRRWSHVMRIVAPEAEVWSWPEAEELAPGEGSAVAVWGWTPAVVEALEAKGVSFKAPPLEVVGEVNDKCFSHGVEKALEMALEGACLVSDEAQCQEAAKVMAGPWVLKHPWGVAGRQQRRGEGAVPEEVLRWAARWWAQGGQMVMEPRVDIEEEWSLHFQVGDTGIEEVGQARLLCDGRGTFRGVEVGELRVDGEALEGARRAAEMVAERGYRGPLGIDGMKGWVGQERVVRAVTEINARWSFGRLGLELRRRLGRGRAVMGWLHPPRGTRPSREGLERLPQEVDPEGRSGSWLYWSDSPSSGAG